MKCKIIKDPEGHIDFVEAPNGAASNLYKDALDFTGNELQALNLWTVPYTEVFKEINGNWETKVREFTDSRQTPERFFRENKKDFGFKTVEEAKKFLKGGDNGSFFEQINNKLIERFPQNYLSVEDSIETFENLEQVSQDVLTIAELLGSKVYVYTNSEEEINFLNQLIAEGRIPSFMIESLLEGNFVAQYPGTGVDILVNQDRIDNIKDKGTGTNILQHELAHVFTAKMLGIEDSLLQPYQIEFKNEVLNAFNTLKRPFGKDGKGLTTLYGFKNPQEFVAEYLSNANFRKVVDHRQKSFFTKIKIFLQKLLGRNNQVANVDFDIVFKDFLNNIREDILVNKFPESSVPLDNNGEPKLDFVLKFSKSLNASNKNLSNKDLDSLRNNLLDLPINSLEELSNVLNSTFYEDGKFLVKRENLLASNLYTMPEVDVIMSNSSVREDIKNIVDRLSSEVLYKDSDLAEKDALVDTLFFSEDLLLSDYSETIGIGKFKKANPHEVDMTIKSLVAGNYTREEFDDAVDGIPFGSIKQLYKDSKEFADDLFNRYSNFKNVLVLNSENLDPVPANDVQTRLEQSLVIAPEDNKIRDDISFLFSLPADIWNTSPEEVTSLLSSVEEKSIDYGIDVIGLSDQYDEASQQDIFEFLVSLQNLINSLDTITASESTITNFTNSYKEFFGIEEQDLQQPIELKNVSEREKNLVILDTNRTELDLFTNDSLLKVRDNIYQKVNKIEDLSTLYTLMYDLVTFNPKVLPEQAYYPSSFDADNTFNLSKLTNPDNRFDVLNDVQRFIRTKIKEVSNNVDPEFNGPQAEALVINKYAFGHSVDSLTPEVNMAQELNRYEAFKGNYSYLTSEFIADFYNTYLIEKQKDSELFNNVLRHFDLSDNGIVLKNVDEYTKQGIRLFSPNTTLFSALKDYSLISKDPNLQDLYTVEQKDSIITDKFLRDFYANNPGALPLFNKDYNNTQDNTVLAALNIQANFIRTPEGVFEKVTENRNVSFYKKLPKLGTPNFREYKTGISVSAANIDISEFNDMIEEVGSPVDVKKLFTLREENSINDELENCD